jgi:uncharacterized protein involved in outer membrane biogenesis
MPIMLPLINLSKFSLLRRNWLRAIVGIVTLIFVCVLYVAIMGISLDISAQRNNAATKLTQSLGREVHFDGPLQLEISAHPKLIIGGIHIANATGFNGNEFASLGQAHLHLDLWPLLWMRFQIEELSGSDVKIHLQTNNSGKNNWAFESNQNKPPATQAPAVKQDANNGLGSLLAHLDIERVSLEKLDVEFTGANSTSHFFELKSLVAQFPIGQPLKLTLNGSVEKSYPYKLELTGGDLAALARFDKPWPIDLKLGFLSSNLSLKGNVSGNSGAINFDLGTNDLNEFERLLQTKLPAVGASRISGDIKYEPGKVALDNLSGEMGQTKLKGVLNVSYGGERPKIQGQITLPVLDLRPFMSGKPVTKEQTPPQSLAQIYREISNATFSLKDLNTADADLTLNVGQWLSLPGAVHDAMLQVKLEHGHLLVPVQATVADVMLTGSASVDAGVNPARFNLALGTNDSNLGNLAGLLIGMPDVKGSLSRFDLHIAARGDRGSELMRSLDVRLNLKQGKLSYGNEAGARQVKFVLDDFVLALPAGKALSGETHGELLNKSFSAELHSGTLINILQETKSPIDLELQAGSAHAQVHAVLQPPTESSGSTVNFELTAPHSGEIASWLGLQPGADMPIGFHGNFYAYKDSWHLADLALKMGHSDLHTDLQHTLLSGKSLIKLQLTGELIDVEEIESLLPVPNEKTPATSPVTVNMIDIPILPQGISLADADVVVRIKRIASKSPLKVHDMSFDGHIRDGMMSASPFSANIADNNFSGSILLDLRTQQPHSVLQLSADSIDIGSILNKLGVAQNIEAGIDHMRLQLDLHSSRLGQVLEQSELGIDFEGGHLTLVDSNTSGKMRIALNNGEIKSAAGKPVQLNLNGSLDNIPVSIGIQTAKAADLINPKLPIPFQFKANTSGADIMLSGDIERPIANTDIELALKMSGSRMDNLNALTHTSLPPWGPWSASGKFRMSRNGYDVSSLLLQVGSSKLSGQGKFNTKLSPPRLDIALEAPSIQIDDFRLGDWSAEKSKPASTAKSKSDDDLKKEARDASTKVQQILSPETLRRQNAYLTVRVDQVLSGQDVLGNGKLDAKLENGRADIGPIIVNTPGGSASMQIGYEPGEKDVAVNFRTAVKRFDYGILARRIDKKSEMRGTFSLDVDVSARTQYLSEILRYGKGHINFAIWPENMKSGLLDVWAVNVLMALLPAVDSSSESKVNCAVGQFELKDGKLSDKTILIDTSRMRVTGKASAGFAEEDIRLYVQPHAKTPQFMSLAIPIELGGKFNDFHVGVSTADVLETLGQFATSVIWVPIEMLFGKTIPADGHDVCEAVEFK